MDNKLSTVLSSHCVVLCCITYYTNEQWYAHRHDWFLQIAVGLGFCEFLCIFFVTAMSLLVGVICRVFIHCVFSVTTSVFSCDECIGRSLQYRIYSWCDCLFGVLSLRRFVKQWFQPINIGMMFPVSSPRESGESHPPKLLGTIPLFPGSAVSRLVLESELIGLGLRLVGLGLVGLSWLGLGFSRFL